MYQLTEVADFAYRDPWQVPLPDRLRALGRGRHRVAYFYEQADNSTFRYRVYNMVHVLNQDPARHSAAYFFLADLHRLDDIADTADLLVICRSRYDSQLQQLVTAFRRRGKRVLFDIDDYVFSTDHVHLLVNTLDLNLRDPQVWQDWFAYCGRLGAALRLCDGGITTNTHLAAKMADFAQIPVAVVPNFMNPEQLEMSERVRAVRSSQRPGADGLIHLGYFSGSPSHNRDFAMVVPALEELLAEDDRLGVVVVGYIEAGPRLERFGGRVVRFPFQDYVNLQKLIGAVEINLMPLQHNVFTNSKSELKYFEAAAVGTVSVASPSLVYAQAIQHRHNGYLAQAHQWFDVLREAVTALPDSRLTERARAHALGTYTWRQQPDAIRRALGLA
jgi:glycosyltransferase involved in cell wall biosynthesis